MLEAFTETGVTLELKLLLSLSSLVTAAAHQAAHLSHLGQQGQGTLSPLPLMPLLSCRAFATPGRGCKLTLSSGPLCLDGFSEVADTPGLRLLPSLLSLLPLAHSCLSSRTSLFLPGTGQEGRGPGEPGRKLGTATICLYNEWDVYSLKYLHLQPIQLSCPA